MKFFHKTTFCLHQKQVVVFPGNQKILINKGQGFQFIGMGKNIFEKSKEVFEEANSILNFDLKNLMFSGDLVIKNNCQFLRKN
jgi:malonyl CoA-acyl carrier protein transacylase